VKSIDDVTLKSILEENGVSVISLEVQDIQENDICSKCGRVLKHPVIIDGKKYGVVCANNLIISRRKIYRREVW